MKKLHRSLLVCLILSAGPVFADGVNLVVNPDFAGSLSGWTVFFASFDGAHSATADGTGSALGSFQQPKGSSSSSALGLVQCITPVTPGATYFFGGKILIPSGQSTTGGGSIAIQWYSGTNCLGFITNASTPGVTQPGDSTDVWHPVGASSVAPGTAGSIRLIASVENSSPELQTFDVNFDEIYLTTEPLASVPGATPLSLAILALSLAAAAVPFLRRTG